jgi:hypothetical protein
MSNLNGFLTRLSPKLASTEQFNKQAIGIRQSIEIEGLIGIGLPAKLCFIFIFNSTLKLTHQNAIPGEENGQFLVGIQQNATTNNIPRAPFPSWFNVLPFKAMGISGDIAKIIMISINIASCKPIEVWTDPCVISRNNAI